MTCRPGGEHLAIRSLLSPPRCRCRVGCSEGDAVLFVGDDWAEDHHDVEIVGEDGRRLAVRRLPEGPGGVAALHALIARFVPPEWGELDAEAAAARVKVGIETDRGPWVAALIATGYEVFAINPMSVSRYRDRHSTSGAKSDAGDAHVLAEIVRLDRAHHRAVASDSTLSQAMKLVARSHQSLIWERTHHALRLRSTLREYFPAALVAFEDLDSSEAMELLTAAPDPDRAARLSRAKIAAALRRAPQGRRTHRDHLLDTAGRGAAATTRGPVRVRGDHGQRGARHQHLDRRDRCVG
jgi:transposase